MIDIMPGKGERSTGKEVNRDNCIATLYFVTMRGRSNDIVKILSWRLIDFCCVRQSKWRGESARKIAGRNSLQVFQKVGGLVAENGIDVILVVRQSTRLIMLWLLCGKSWINFVCMLLSQVALPKKISFLWLTACSSHFSSPIRNSCKSWWLQWSCRSVQSRFQLASWWDFYGTRNQKGMKSLWNVWRNLWA